MTLEALGWSERRQKEFEPHAAEGLLPGRVVGEHRSHYQVATEALEVPAQITGRMRNSAEHRSDLPGVGDFVALAGRRVMVQRQFRSFCRGRARWFERPRVNLARSSWRRMSMSSSS
jgi:hypothetical protein